MAPAQKVLSEISVICDHCGEDCQEPSLIDITHSFCCQGCKTVYELLQESGMAAYYQLESRPGSSLQNYASVQYAYLDEPEVRQKILDYSDEETARVTFSLPQIHCVSCVWLLENSYKIKKGILRSKVNFLKREVYLTYSKSSIQLSQIADFLQSIGYPPSISLASLDQQQPAAIPKALYYKLGLTGFVFGNVMFMSFPEYLGLDKGMDTLYFHLFGYLNLVLGIPLVFYSAGDYLRGAYWGLRQKTLSLDVPISIGILSLFGRSAYEILSHTGAGYIDSLGGLVFFLLIGKWFQQKTFHRISFERDYQSYFPIAANMLAKGKEIAVSLQQLKPGDYLRIRNRELIPADGLLRKGVAYIDYSFVTGEASPVPVAIGEMVYAGGRQIGGIIEVALTRKVIQSYLVQLWKEQVFEQKEKKFSASNLASVIGKYFTIAILFIALTTLLFWLPKDSGIAINAFSAVLIIACPCAIALSIPFTFGNVLRLLGAHQFYLKNTEAIEQIQNCTHIVFDKTGTLTQRRERLVFNGHLNEKERALVKSLASQSGHPRSEQIFHFLEKSPTLEVHDFVEIPGEGIYATVENTTVSLGKDPLGKRPGTIVEIAGKTKGYFTHQPILRPGLQQMFTPLQQDFELYLLSGDQDRHRDHFKALFESDRALYFNQSPKDKLEFIRKLQDSGANVMMIGDGLNDAGALQQADVGLVLSEDQNNFSPACDGVLSTNAFRHFPKILQFIRKSRWIIYGAYGLALLYNGIGLTYAVQGLLSPVIAAILMPLSSVSIVLLGVLGTWGLAHREGIINIEKQDDKNHRPE